MAYPAPQPGAFLEIVRKLDAGAPPATGRKKMLRSTNDVEAVAEFLREFASSPNTFRAYQKEAERFLFWCALVAGVRFEDLDREHAREFEKFLASPPDDWISDARAPRHSEKWRPFRKKLSGDSLLQGPRVVSTMLDFFVAGGYIRCNPWGLVRKRVQARSSDREPLRAKDERHRLTPEAVTMIADWLHALPSSTRMELEQRWRKQVIMDTFLLTGARRTELSSATVDNLVCEESRWWLYVRAKGGGTGKLPICETALEAIKRYRACRGLPPLPMRGDAGPLIAKLGNPKAGLTGNMVYRIVREILSGSAQLAKERGQEDLAHQLSNASTHWLRHTTLGTVADQTKDLRLVKQLGRHVSADTTMRYLREEDNRFHDSVTPHLEELIKRNPPR